MEISHFRYQFEMEIITTIGILYWSSKQSQNFHFQRRIREMQERELERQMIEREREEMQWEMERRRFEMEEDRRRFEWEMEEKRR